MGRYRRLKEVPDEVVRLFRGRLGYEDIKFLYKKGVVSGRWDEEDLRILGAFARVWDSVEFLKRLLVRKTYRERVMIVETAGYGRLGSVIYAIIRQRLDEGVKIDVERVVDEVIEKMNVEGTEGFRRYLRELVKRIRKHVLLMRGKRR